MDEQKNKTMDDGVDLNQANDPSQNEKSIELKKSDEPEIDEMTTLHERVIATLSYMGPLAIVPFYLKKDSKFCRFHGKQGLIMFIILFFMLPLMVLDLIFDAVLIIQVIIFAYMGLAALSGRWKKLPLIYNYACKLEDTLSLQNKAEKDEEKMNVGETISKKDTNNANS